jgi:predicted kinase
VPRTGSETTRLIILRGNSASGKSTVAAGIRERYGRGIAIVGQDNLRRIVLRERDIPGGANIGLIDSVARYALDHGFHVIVEGILRADRYTAMLTTLRDDHRGLTHLYYFDVPFEETLRRHATKPQASEYGRAEMSDWYREHDVLPDDIEQIILADSPLHATVERVMNDTGLAMRDGPAVRAAEAPPQRSPWAIHHHRESSANKLT